jgi:hypothetical protein
MFCAKVFSPRQRLVLLFWFARGRASAGPTARDRSDHAATGRRRFRTASRLRIWTSFSRGPLLLAGPLIRLRRRPKIIGDTQNPETPTEFDRVVLDPRKISFIALRDDQIAIETFSTLGLAGEEQCQFILRLLPLRIGAFLREGFATLREAMEYAFDLPTFAPFNPLIAAMASSQFKLPLTDDEGFKQHMQP